MSKKKAPIEQVFERDAETYANKLLSDLDGADKMPEELLNAMHQLVRDSYLAGELHGMQAGMIAKAIAAKK